MKTPLRSLLLVLALSSPTLLKADELFIGYVGRGTQANVAPGDGLNGGLIQLLDDGSFHHLASGFSLVNVHVHGIYGDDPCFVFDTQHPLDYDMADVSNNAPIPLQQEPRHLCNVSYSFTVNSQIIYFLDGAGFQLDQANYTFGTPLFDRGSTNIVLHGTFLTEPPPPTTETPEPEALLMVLSGFSIAVKRRFLNKI
jgi:hypothetical protein